VTTRTCAGSSSAMQPAGERGQPRRFNDCSASRENDLGVLWFCFDWRALLNRNPARIEIRDILFEVVPGYHKPPCPHGAFATSRAALSIHICFIPSG
jgi:hypothetical protein